MAFVKNFMRYALMALVPFVGISAFIAYNDTEHSFTGLLTAFLSTPLTVGIIFIFGLIGGVSTLFRKTETPEERVHDEPHS